MHLTDLQDTQTAGLPTATDAEAPERFVCPVTHLHSTRYPFVAISGCGHVFSDRAIKQVAASFCTLKSMWLQTKWSHMSMVVSCHTTIDMEQL